MLKSLAWGALACALMAAPAWANVTYNLSNIVATTDDPSAPFFPISNILFTVSDAAVSRGTFALSGLPHTGAATPSNPITYAGDTADFVGLSVAGEGASPSYLYGLFTLGFTFDTATQAVTSTLLDFSGVAVGVRLTGTGATASGSYGADGVGCHETGEIQCRISGTWMVSTAIPEPSGLVVLTTALGMLLWRRWRYDTFGMTVPPEGATAHTR